MTRQSERGSAMLITLVLIASLIAGAAVVVSMQLSSTKSADVTKTGMTSLYCAEAGLAAAHTYVALNKANWNAALALSAANDFTEPTWLQSAFSHDLDQPADGVADFQIYLKDNDDETGTNNLAADLDGRVWIISRCIKYADNPKQVGELVEASGGSHCYDSQEGGCGGNGNAN
jgi:hypothetical protein